MPARKAKSVVCGRLLSWVDPYSNCRTGTPFKGGSYAYYTRAAIGHNGARAAHVGGCGVRSGSSAKAAAARALVRGIVSHTT
jgi:hypothetical protein